ncbi:MAG: hypothetical protein M0Z96_02780 [Actinomycetota bacterium]|nr:hypothetical protein [Actinomycetota bacterium]
MSKDTSNAFSPLTVERVSLHSFDLNLVRPVIGAGQRHFSRSISIVELHADGLSGFGEVASLELPNYSSEWARGGEQLLRKVILPGLIERSQINLNSLDWLVGNGSVRFAVECAALDLQAKRLGFGLTEFLADTFGSSSYEPSREIRFGVAIGAYSGWSDALSESKRAITYGARRIKFKVNGVRAREFLEGQFTFDGVDIVFDFNGSLGRTEVSMLDQLAGVGLSLIEEPSIDLGLIEYMRLAESVNIPIFLDESADSRAVLNDMANVDTGLGLVVKPAKFGSVLWLNKTLEALADRGVRCYLGGMFESSIGRRFLLAFGSHRCFTEVGDMAPSDWYYTDDIRPHVVADAGRFSLNSNFDFGCDVGVLEHHLCGDRCFTWE